MEVSGLIAPVVVALQGKDIRVSALIVAAVAGLQKKGNHIVTDMNLLTESELIAGNHLKPKGAIAIGDQQLLALHRLQVLAADFLWFKDRNFKQRVDISKQR